MKRIFASLLSMTFFFGLLSAQNDPTLMKINGKPIALSEFEYIYNKNNSANVIDKKSLDEYVDLFVVFKLKVEEAIAQGIDTTKAFITELDMYRNQLAEQYMQSPNWADALAKESYERRREEVNVSHIMIRLNGNGTAADTLEAYNKAMKIYNRALKEDFAKLAHEFSEDQSVENNGGVVGWISSLRVPYKFETAAYNTPVGQISKPVRTTFGYHIIKVNDRRLSKGEVKASHIMIMDNGKDAELTKILKQRADSIHRCLVSGEDFAEMAKKHSEDPGSAQQGGELPWFGSGQMVPEFEDAAFAIQHTSQITEPIKSPYGWHIIKLIDKKPFGKFEDMEKNITSQLEQSELGKEKNNFFTAKLKEEYIFTDNKVTLQEIVDLADLHGLNDSIFATEASKLNKPLFSFANVKKSQQDFISYLNNSNHPKTGIVLSDYIKDKYQQFVNTTITKFERENLTNKYADYRNLMQEYHDGILLFEVMNKEVWERASTDSEGLSAYFNNNRSDYTWSEPHYKGFVIQAKDKASLKAAKNIVKRADRDSISIYINKRLNDSIQYVKVEKGIWSKGENKFVDQKIFKTNKLEVDEAYPHVLFSGKLLKNPEEYSDIRGIITTNYQDYLEKEWIESLRQKYPVEIDKNVLKLIQKN